MMEIIIAENVYALIVMLRTLKPYLIFRVV